MQPITTGRSRDIAPIAYVPHPLVNLPHTRSLAISTSKLAVHTRIFLKKALTALQKIDYVADFALSRHQSNCNIVLMTPDLIFVRVAS